MNANKCAVQTWDRLHYFGHYILPLVLFHSVQDFTIILKWENRTNKHWKGVSKHFTARVHESWAKRNKNEKAEKNKRSSFIHQHLTLPFLAQAWRLLVGTDIIIIIIVINPRVLGRDHSTDPLDCRNRILDALHAWIQSCYFNTQNAGPMHPSFCSQNWNL